MIAEVLISHNKTNHNKYHVLPQTPWAASNSRQQTHDLEIPFKVGLGSIATCQMNKYIIKREHIYT